VVVFVGEVVWSLGLVRGDSTRNVGFQSGSKRMDISAKGLYLPHPVFMRTLTKGSKDVAKTNLLTPNNCGFGAHTTTPVRVTT